MVAVVAVLLSYKILPPPGIAPVIADEERSTYASTACVISNTLDRELIANRAEIEDPDNSPPPSSQAHEMARMLSLPSPVLADSTADERLAALEKKMDRLLVSVEALRKEVGSLRNEVDRTRRDLRDAKR